GSFTNTAFTDRSNQSFTIAPRNPGGIIIARIRSALQLPLGHITPGSAPGPVEKRVVVIDALFVAPKHHQAVAAVLDGAVCGFVEGVAVSVLLELGLREAAADAVELDVAAAAVGVALLDEDEETGGGDGGREGGEDDEEEEEEDVEEWDKHTSDLNCA
ncbi:MAG: hypothetical protein Q9185_007147, partial [Variospora sp. 1 TL-2023]